MVDRFLVLEKFAVHLARSETSVMGGPSPLDGDRFLDNFGFRKSLTGRFPHLASLSTPRAIWLELEIGIQLVQQRSIVAPAEMDFRQQQVAQRKIRPP